MTGWQPAFVVSCETISGIEFIMKSILLVEDERELIELMGAMLEDEGYGIRRAMSGEEAVRLCREKMPDLIISDVKMGEMDGFTMIETIHGMAKTKNIPFIFLTALDESFGGGKAKTLGATAYITKPFETDDLLQRVKQILPLS